MESPRTDYTSAASPAHGSTALGPARRGPRQLIGSAARAVGVFVDATFRVIVLGRDGVKL